MKKLFFIILSIALISQTAYSQNDCIPDPFITKNYFNDAKRMALEEMLKTPKSPYLDSINVPGILSDKYLRILSSAYKSNKEPFDKGIHKANSTETFIFIEVDKRMKGISTFVKNKGGEINNAAFDKLISLYQLRLMELGFNTDTAKYTLMLVSPLVLNSKPLVNKFCKISGITNSTNNGLELSPPNNITFDFNKKLLEFVFNSGVMRWSYKVTNPCSAELTD